MPVPFTSYDSNVLFFDSNVLILITRVVLRHHMHVQKKTDMITYLQFREVPFGLIRPIFYRSCQLLHILTTCDDWPHSFSKRAQDEFSVKVFGSSPVGIAWSSPCRRPIYFNSGWIKLLPYWLIGRPIGRTLFLFSFSFSDQGEYALLRKFQHTTALHQFCFLDLIKALQ